MKAVVFDMDGLLIDSEPLWRQAEIEILGSVGLRLTELDCEQTMGLRTDELVGFWFDRRPWSGPPPGAVAAAIDSRVIELIEDRGTALPGALEAVREVHQSGRSVGLASSSCLELIEAVIRRLGIERFFSEICSATDEARGKPDPAVYLTMSRRLGIPPADCVAMEDSVVGVRSARAAGMAVIAVPVPHQFDLPGFDAAHLKLRSLEEFSVELVTRLGCEL